MFRSVAVSRLVKRAFESAAERKNTVTGIQNIIRCSLTEFDKGAEEYRVFRESHDTPDWGVVRMSSIAMAHRRFEEAELFLKEQMEEYGGIQKRQARNVDVTDEQICSAIERVLKKDETAEMAFQFFEFLKKYKFCATRDVFVRVLIQFVVEKQGWQSGLNRLEQLMKHENRSKSMKMSVYFILENAWTAGEFDKAESLISKLEVVKPSTLRLLQLFIRLNELSSLEAADYCRRTGVTVSHEDVMFLSEMSGTLKFPMPLIRLLDIHEFNPIPKTTHFPILDELIKLAGKSGEAENLEEMILKVDANRVIDDHQKLILCKKIRHFYKCLNVKAPEKLYFLMKSEN